MHEKYITLFAFEVNKQPKDWTSIFSIYRLYAIQVEKRMSTYRPHSSIPYDIRFFSYVDTLFCFKMEVDTKYSYAHVLSNMIMYFSPGIDNKRYTASDIAASWNPKSTQGVRRLVVSETALFPAFQEPQCRNVLLNFFPSFRSIYLHLYRHIFLLYSDMLRSGINSAPHTF